MGDETFDLLHVKAEDNTVNGNKLYLCAHNRLVETKELDKYITDLDREIYEKSGFWYIGVLRSKYLDDSVDMNRLSFNIPDGGPLESLINIITMDQIMKAVIVEVEKFLEDYLQPISCDKLKRIKDYVSYQAPQFRHLLKYMSDDIVKIKPNLSDDKLDDELHRIKRKFDRRTSDENKKLLRDLNEGIISSVAVSDEANTGTEYETIVLFELKRPMRNDYNDGSNPVTQLYNYVAFLKSGKAMDKDGRLIKAGANTKFYLYAVCDVTNTLERIPDYHDFTQTPDKLGFYRYNEKMNAYIEILSYDKIINDAKQRNKILFDKLGI